MSDFPEEGRSFSERQSGGSKVSETEISDLYRLSLFAVFDPVRPIGGY